MSYTNMPFAQPDVRIVLSDNLQQELRSIALLAYEKQAGIPLIDKITAELTTTVVLQKNEEELGVKGDRIAVIRIHKRENGEVLGSVMVNVETKRAFATVIVRNE